MADVFDQVDLYQLPKVAEQIITHAAQVRLWAFYGEMGAGKTTLIKEICRQLHVTGEISSPTYSLVNEYQTDSGQVIYHFDFYRIKSLEEVYDMGYEDYFYSGNICLVEWPENIAGLIKNETYLKIQISRSAHEHRKITIELAE